MCAIFCTLPELTSGARPETCPCIRSRWNRQGFPTAFYIWFRSTWGLDGVSHYSYCLDGVNCTPSGEPYQLLLGNCRGDRIGIYMFNDDADAGSVDSTFSTTNNRSVLLRNKNVSCGRG